ncbi:MAG: aminotransferase class III-fold pyridoxal phosphate-dependent enzyme, partial [Alphaproteobacteria bacterium]
MISPLLPTYARAPLAFERGEGSWLIDTEGRRFLDLAAGIAVNALGHAHPRLVATLAEQGARLWHVSNLYRIPEQERLAERLVAETFADTVFFTNSGTEAAELAIKMARRFWHERGEHERTRILTFEGAFHGRSIAAISAAGAEKLTRGFEPLLPGFTRLPFGDAEEIGAALSAELEKGDVAAVMLEPV